MRGTATLTMWDPAAVSGVKKLRHSGYIRRRFPAELVSVGGSHDTVSYSENSDVGLAADGFGLAARQDRHGVPSSCNAWQQAHAPSISARTGLSNAAQASTWCASLERLNRCRCSHSALRRFKG